MTSFIRDLLKAMSYEPGTAGRLPMEGEALARLDERLRGLSHSEGRGRSAISVRPGDCAMWEGSPRDMGGLTARHCRSLIEAIAQEGGNRIPVVLRPAPFGSDCPYELLVGSRRHFSVDWLNHNGRPEIRLNALVVDLTDEEAFRLADIENQDRKDIAELDRARSYLHALERFYGGVQSRMAEALNLSNSQLSRLLALAEMPDEVVEAFAARDELRVRHSEVLTPMLRKPEQRKLIIAEAKRICAEQERLCANDEKMLPAAAVLAQLKDAGSAVPGGGTVTVTASPGTASGDRPQEQPLTLRGDRFGQVRIGKDGVEARLVISGEADLDEVLASLRDAILDCRRAAGEPSVD